MVDLMEDILNQVIRREGGAKATNLADDKGGRTQFGISEKSNPEAWIDGKVTEDEARAIYLQKYVQGPGFDKVTDSHLMAHLVDFGVNSGPMIAIQKLQLILGVEQDGILGPLTLEALSTREARATNNLLVAERIKMIGRICTRDKSQITFLNGWLARCLEFLR